MATLSVGRVLFLHFLDWIISQEASVVSWPWQGAVECELFGPLWEISVSANLLLL
jgi:hypothetical protein